MASSPEGRPEGARKACVLFVDEAQEKSESDERGLGGRGSGEGSGEEVQRQRALGEDDG